MPASAVISVLARSLLAGEATVEAVHERAVRTLGRPWRWLRPLAARYAAAFGGKARPRHRDVVLFLRNDSGLRRAWAKCRDELSIRSLFSVNSSGNRVARGLVEAPLRHHLSVAQWLAEPQRMQPVSAAERWDLPIIETAGDLADWLSLSTDDLEWFADLKALGNKLRNLKLQHYHYSIRAKRSGGVRLIEIPKPRLKELQRRILAGILDCIPVHAAVHGFVKKRSIVTFAAPHAGKAAVLRLDLQDFFPGFPAARVQALFRTLGYPEKVADRLGGICTNVVPRDVWKVRPMEIAAREWQEARTLYAGPHLPQGAPTSPALANLTA